jgi:hypothetical protein
MRHQTLGAWTASDKNSDDHINTTLASLIAPFPVCFFVRCNQNDLNISPKNFQSNSLLTFVSLLQDILPLHRCGRKRKYPRSSRFLPRGGSSPSVGLAVAPHDAKQLRHIILLMCIQYSTRLYQYTRTRESPLNMDGRVGSASARSYGAFQSPPVDPRPKDLIIRANPTRYTEQVLYIVVETRL